MLLATEVSTHITQQCFSSIVIVYVVHTIILPKTMAMFKASFLPHKV